MDGSPLGTCPGANFTPSTIRCASVSPLTPPSGSSSRPSTCTALEDQWAAALRATDVVPGDVARLTAAVDLRTQRLTASLEADPPAWLSWWLGAPPKDPAGAVTYHDTVAHLAAWRDRHDLSPATPGYGTSPDDVGQLVDWQEAMRATLTTRAWLAQRSAHLEPVEHPPLERREIDGRLAELDELLGTAPPDQTRLIEDLIGGRLTVTDLHQALDDADLTQARRRDWILAHWPHVVEHHQLQRLAVNTLPDDVSAALERLAATTLPPTEREARSLAQLHLALEELDPGRHAADVMRQLVEVSDRRHAIERQLETVTVSEHRVLLLAEDQELTHRQLQLRHDVRAEREKLATMPGRVSGPTTELHHAIARRQTTVVHDTLTRPPGWLIRWLTELNDQGTLIQLPDRDLHEQIAEIGHYRDRWDITSPEPLGRPPSPALPQFRDWQHLAVRIEPPGTTRAIGHDVDLVRP